MLALPKTLFARFPRAARWVGRRAGGELRGRFGRGPRPEPERPYLGPAE
jgi:hypothetical protein